MSIVVVVELDYEYVSRFYFSIVNRYFKYECV